MYICDTKGKGKGKAGLLTGLEWPREFQEVKVPRFRDDTGTSRLYPQEIHLVVISVRG